MGLSIQRYETKYGFDIENGYLTLDDFSYGARLHQLNFSMSLYIDKEKADLGFQPVEANVISGSLEIDLTGEVNIPRQIDLIVLQKIQEVEGKTIQEIRDHNASLDPTDITNSWVQYWDEYYQKFIGASLYTEIVPGEAPTVPQDVTQER